MPTRFLGLEILAMVFLAYGMAILHGTVTSHSRPRDGRQGAFRGVKRLLVPAEG